jgi:hypothetical protein
MDLKRLVPMVEVENVTRSAAFYAKLGFEIGNTFVPSGAAEPSWAWLRNGEVDLMVTSGESPASTSRPVLFYLYCSDVAEARKSLEAAGVECGPPDPIDNTIESVVRFLCVDGRTRVGRSGDVEAVPPGCSRVGREQTQSLRKESSTMRSANSFASKITSWELLATNIQPLLPDLPFLQAFYNQLQALIVLARELDSQQETARGEARELTRRRQEVEREGENLRARAMAHLRATYGFTSEQLIRFGINPRPRTTRRQETPVPAPE